MPVEVDDHQLIRRLHAIVRIARRLGPAALSREQLAELPQLYRHAASLVARLESSDHDPRTLAELRPLLLRAHGVLYKRSSASQRSLLSRMAEFLWVECAQTIRAEWKLLAATGGLLYGVAILAYFVVRQDLSLAYSLLSPEVVGGAIADLRALEAGESYRGNFTFGMGDSGNVAGYVMGNNMRVAALFFASALVPPLYVLILAQNGMMLGTYTAVAGHWDQAGSISSILWCHGVIEIQTIILAGMAGLILLRAWIAPGPWSRTHAMKLESQRAWRVLVPAFPLLFIAGLIESFVSPHAPLAIRLLVALLTGCGLVAWIVIGGRPQPAR